MSENAGVPEGTCQRCGREPASVHIRKVAGGEEEILHVCASCAKELGAEPGSANLSLDPITVLFRSMEETEDTGAICPGCGLTYERFRETGRVGCATCYQTFEGELRLLMRRVHGAIRHRGKSPVGEGQMEATEAAVRRLNEELDRAVATEDYERAAKLRDRLKALQENAAGGGGATA